MALSESLFTALTRTGLWQRLPSHLCAPRHCPALECKQHKVGTVAPGRPQHQRCSGSEQAFSICCGMN